MSSNIERKLAAIMFTDISGYTAQMSKDQDVALSMLDTKRKALQPLIEKHKGTLVKEMGDGTLSHFPSAVDATNCSLDLQKSLKDNNDLNIRIGVHLGDTSFKDDDVFGDGVNIASRLEKMSPPGGVLVSKNVYDELSSRKGYDGISLGLQSMKGVGRLVEVFGLKDTHLNVPIPSDYIDTKVEAHKDKEVPSIAIIPFDNKGNDEDVFFAYGISTDIVSDIAGAGLIRVASQKEIDELGDIPIKQKAKELKTRYLCTGTLWKVNDMFQLSVELYDTKNSRVVWSDRWAENWENLTIIKETLSKNLLSTLNKEFSSVESMSNNKIEAYEFYLKGKYKIDRAKKAEDVEIGIELLEKAIDIDSELFEARFLLMHNMGVRGNVSKGNKIADETITILEKSKNKKNFIKAVGARWVLRISELIINKEDINFNLNSNSKIIKELLIDIHRGINLCIEINDLESLRGIKHMQIQTYMLSNQLQKALETSIELLENYKKICDEKGEANVSWNLGRIYVSLGKFEKGMIFLKKWEDTYDEKSKRKIKLRAMEIIELKVIEKENLDLEYKECKKLVEYYKSKGSVGPLGLAYRLLLLIQFRRGKYSSIIDIYNKSKENLSSTDYDYSNVNRLAERVDDIILALSKKILGDNNSSAIKNLEKIAEKDEEGCCAYWHNYYAYQLFGVEKGRKFLKIAYDKIHELKSNLKGKELESFLNAYHINLILNEWNQITN